MIILRRVFRTTVAFTPWFLRVLVFALVIGILSSFSSSPGLNGLLWILWGFVSVVSIPMGSTLRALLLKFRTVGARWPECRAAVALTGRDKQYLWWRSGVGQTDDEVRRARLERRNPGLEEDQDSVNLISLFTVLVGFRYSLVRYFDTPRLLSWSLRPGFLSMVVRRTKSGQSAEDLCSPETVGLLTQTMRELTGFFSLQVRAEAVGPNTQLNILFVDPLQGRRDSLEPSAGLVRIGVDETGNDVFYDPFEATHTAVQGMTRSGKSTQEDTRLSGLAGRNDVRVCGLDPTAVLLGPWVGVGGGLIATPATANETPVYQHFLEVITAIVAVMDERTMNLAAMSRDKLDRVDFSAVVPVLVVVLEEWPGILRASAAEDAAESRKPAERVAAKIEAAVGRLVAEGAKSGIRVLLLGQRLSAKALDTDSRSNFGVRHTLRVDNADAVGMLHDNSAQWAPIVAKFEPGLGLLEAPGKGQRRYRADFTDYETYLRRVKAVSRV